MSIQPISDRILTQPTVAEDTSLEKNTIAEILATLAQVIQQSERLDRKRVHTSDDDVQSKRVCLEVVQQESGAAMAAGKAREIALEALLEVSENDEIQPEIENRVIESKLTHYAFEGNFLFKEWHLDHLNEVDDSLLFAAFANHSGPFSYLVTKLFLEAEPAKIDADRLKRLLELISDEEFADYILQKHNHLSVSFFSSLSIERQKLGKIVLQKFVGIAEQLEKEGTVLMTMEINNLEDLALACRRFLKLRQDLFLLEEQESDIYLSLCQASMDLPINVIEQRLAGFLKNRVEEGWIEELAQKVTRTTPPPQPESLPHDGLYRLFRNIDRGDALAPDHLFNFYNWDKHPLTELTTYGIMTEASETDHQEFLAQVEKGDVISYALEKESNHDLDSLPKEALAALLNEAISIEQFVSAILLWEALSTFGQTVRVGESVLECDDLDEDTLPEKLLTSMSVAHPQKRVWDRFIEIMNDDSIPASEKKCLVFSVNDTKSTPRLLEAVANSGLDYPGILNGNFGQMGVCVVPSFTMIQALLVAEFGDNAVLPRPVFGQSSMADVLRSVATHEHDMGLGYPGITLPGQVDEKGADKAGYSFSIHDIFHCRLASAIPANHRQFFTSIASLFRLQAESATDQQERESWLELAWNFVDMIQHDYAKNGPSSESDLESNFRGFLNLINFVENSSAVKNVLLSYLRANGSELIELIGPDCYRDALEKCE